jgi:hypothetical protein
VTATSATTIRTVNSAPIFQTPPVESLLTAVGESFAYKLPDCVDPDGDEFNRVVGLGAASIFMTYADGYF